MSELNRFFKNAKNIIVDPGHDIEDRIISRIENLSDEDREILDENFMEFLKKSNSRLYLFNKKIKENSGYFIAFSILGLAAGIFLIVQYLNYRKNKQGN